MEKGKRDDGSAGLQKSKIGFWAFEKEYRTYNQGKIKEKVIKCLHDGDDSTDNIGKRGWG